MKEYRLTDFLKVTREMVMFSKAVGTNECKRLNSFLIIDSKFNFDTDSFDAKMERNFYFSRDEKKIMFPALVISLSSDELGDFQNGKYNAFCHPMSIGIVDQYVLNCIDCTYCGKRTQEEIYIDTAILLRQFVNALVGIKLFDIVTGGNHTLEYSHQGIVDAKIAANIFDSATIVKSESAVLKNEFSERNPNIILNDLQLSKQNTLAKWVDITICDICSNESELQFSYKKFKNETCC